MCYHQQASFRRTLDDILQHQNCPLKINQSGSKTDITEKVKWLQNKVQQQSVQIQTLSSQLSKQMRMKDHIQSLLYQQKQKRNRINSSVNATSRQQNSTKQDSTRKNIGDDDSIPGQEKKILHIVDKIRNKDLLANKNKLKMDENAMQSSNCPQMEKEVCTLRELFVDSQHKELSLLQQISSMKIQLWEREQQLSQCLKKYGKIKVEHQVVVKQLCSQQEEIKMIHEDTKELMKRQNQQIQKLQNELARYCPEDSTKQKQNLEIAKRQIRKALATHLHDDCLRKKVQTQMLIVLETLAASISYPRHPSTNE